MSHRNMPWDQIRQAYETTETPLGTLAKQFGIPSRTTLVRRAEAEGWQKNLEAIAERNRLADAVLDRTAEPATLDEALAAPPYMPPPQPASGHRQPAMQVPVDLVPVDLVPADPEGVGYADVQRLLIVAELAEQQAAVRRQQLALAAEVQLTGLLLLRRIQGVLQPPVAPDQAGGPEEELMLGNLQRLIRVNPDKETLAGLVGVAAKTIEAGVGMARKALAMDLPGGMAKPGAAQAVANPAPSADATSRNRIALLNSMTPEMAEKMRDWALKVQQERREAQIAAATTQ
jgi:hypothetical protein